MVSHYSQKEVLARSRELNTKRKKQTRGDAIVSIEYNTVVNWLQEFQNPCFDGFRKRIRQAAPTALLLGVNPSMSRKALIQLLEFYFSASVHLQKDVHKFKQGMGPPSHLH